MKSKKAFYIAITVIFTINLVACSKSQSRQSNSGGGNIIIGVKDDGYSLYFGIYGMENYGKEVYPLADAYGEIKDSSTSLELHVFILSKIPWTMPGEYYIRFIFSFDNVFHFYTNGYTLPELGINGLPETDEDYRKMPTCILGPGENFINFSQQVLKIERGDNL